MLRWTLLGISLLTLALGLLTTFQAPAWIDWRLSILAGEFGYAVAVVPVAILIVEGCRGGVHSAVGAAVLVAAGLAAAFLLKPVVQAEAIGRRLPARLDAAFGPARPSRPAFSLGALFRGRPRAGKVETLAYAGDLGLDFYPAAGRAPAPCVIVLHSGGWNSGERGEFPDFNHWLADRGYAVAAISYRLAPQSIWPAQRDDIVAAVDFLRAHAGALGLDPGRLVLFGRSAGGQLAEATAYGVPRLALRGVVALYGPADLNFAYAFGKEDDVLKSPLLLRQFLGGPPSRAQAAFDSASAIGHATPASPPTLLLHGQLDALVWHRQSERLAQRLGELGVPHLFVSLPWATHAFEFNVNGPGGQLTTFAVEWFLGAVTK
jgi:acetyl esterase/lipase